MPSRSLKLDLQDRHCEDRRDSETAFPSCQSLALRAGVPLVVSVAYLTPSNAHSQSGEKLPPIDPTAEEPTPTLDPAAPDLMPPTNTESQAQPDSTLKDSSVGVPDTLPGESKGLGAGPEAVFLPVILAISLLIGAGAAFLWYNKYLETILRGTTIHSPSSHMSTSIGVALSVAALITGSLAQSLLPFAAAIGAVVGALLCSFGSRHKPAFALAIAAIAVCVFRGTFNVMSA